jgi:hypothetical protein
VADTVALVALYVVPVPVLNVMGGIADPGQQSIAIAALLVLFLCWATLLVWILLAATAVIASRAEPRWQAGAQPDRPAMTALVFAVLILMVWAALLPITQPAHRLAKQVERVHRDAGPAAAQAVISDHARADFPIDWEPPPPRGSQGQTASDILAALEAIAEHPRARWVGELYNADWVRRRMGNDHLWPEEMIRDHLVRLAAVSSKLPRGTAIARMFVSHPQFDRLIYTDNELEGPAREQAVQTLKRLAEAAGYGKSAENAK